MYIRDPDALYDINNVEVRRLHGHPSTWPALIIWIIAWLVRKKQGMALEAVAKEIPVE